MVGFAPAAYVDETGRTGPEGMPEVIWFKGTAPGAPLTVFDGTATAGVDDELPAGVVGDPAGTEPVEVPEGAAGEEALETAGACFFARSA